jgi:hypothetical protein
MEHIKNDLRVHLKNFFCRFKRLIWNDRLDRAVSVEARIHVSEKHYLLRENLFENNSLNA